MRVDGPWSYGPVVARPWLFCMGMLPNGWAPQWQNKSLHVGHFPANLPLMAAPAPDLWWRHYAYLRKDHRVKKHQQYMQQAPTMTEFERMHAATIID